MTAERGTIVATGRGAMPGPTILRLEPAPPSEPSPGRRIVVLDTTWTAPRGGDGDAAPIGIREAARRVLAARDLIVETADLLDAWAVDSGVVDALTAEETSFWYYVRLRHWMWLQQQILWLGIVGDLVQTTGATELECAAGTDEGLVAAARLLADASGLQLRVDSDGTADTPDLPPAPAARPESGAPGLPTGRRAVVWVNDRLRGLRHALIARMSREEPMRRRRTIVSRLGRLSGQRARPLLVVLEHARQRVDSPAGPRLMNPYLGPIVDRLRGTRLDPVEIDIRAKLADDAAWELLTGPDAERLLPADAVWLSEAPRTPDSSQAWADEAADAIAASNAPIRVSGVDLGPALTARIAGEVRRTMANHVRNVGRIRRLLRRLAPAGVMLADEYHRQEWLAAAYAEGLPTVAVQHGMIYRWHNGYIHRTRPAALRLPNRTYVFGEWEQQLLRTASVYRSDEVAVGGSPRLDLMDEGPVDRDGIRAELGIAAGVRMVVVSGTWGQIYRRFHYPITLSALVDRPLPNVHIVIKLHPGEPDEGPYRQVIEAAAAAGGFDPPPVTIVRAVDLYRLLAAADAHLGVNSTVITEAVVVGTPNLLCDTLAASDLLGYVPAGVARVVRNGGDLLAALEDAAAQPLDETARRRFLDAHFEPGNASERIAGDLLAWLR